MVQGLIDLARMGEPVDAGGCATGSPPTARRRSSPASGADGRIVLPGHAAAIVPKTPGQSDYLQHIARRTTS